jgi:hypothetical protein
MIAQRLKPRLGNTRGLKPDSVSSSAGFSLWLQPSRGFSL